MVNYFVGDRDPAQPVLVHPVDWLPKLKHQPNHLWSTSPGNQSELHTGCLKKRNTFDLEYLKDASIILIVLLVCYLLLPYNSKEPNFSFL